MPTVGSVFDTINAAWYFSEGNYGEAALSFFGALPGIGDMAVAGVKGLSFCTKGAKIFRLAAKIIGNAGNIALAAPKATEAIIQLWDKHVIRGQGWDDESLSIAIEGATFGITAILSAKNLGETFGNIRNELNDIKTSQCFVEGTLIVTADGDKPIEEIQAGDLVYSTNPETGESEYKEVLRTFRKESDVLIHIFVNGEEIETTPVHPFWVEDQWVAAKDLEAGDILTLADGSTAPVTYTYGEKLDEPVIVYNFEVSDFHTYYVTDTSVLVHNATAFGCTPKQSTSKNAKDLRNNMEKEGRIVQKNEAAAHIVASNGSKRQWAAAAESRDLLNKYSININDAANGVALGNPYPHNTTHTRVFHENVKTRLYDVEKSMQQEGYGWKAIRRALRRELRKIGGEI